MGLRPPYPRDRCDPLSSLVGEAKPRGDSPRSAVGAKLDRGLGGEVHKGTELRHRTHSTLTPMGAGGEARSAGKS